MEEARSSGKSCVLCGQARRCLRAGARDRTVIEYVRANLVPPIAEEGISFSSLLDRLRRSLALEYLRKHGNTH